MIEDIQAAGANSLRSIAKELNGHRISAPRGGEWSAAQVRSVHRENAALGGRPEAIYSRSYL